MRRLLPVLFAATLVATACSSGGSDADVDSASTEAATATTGGPPATEPADGVDPSATDPVASEPTVTDAPSTTDAPTTEAPTTTAAPESDVTAADLAGPGPYAVGVVTRQLPEGNAVEVWYPADEAARGGIASYAVRSFLPPAIADLVPDTVDDSRSIDATRDAAPAADGPFPIVLFSHGSTSFRLQSSVLAQHLATWGSSPRRRITRHAI